MTKKDIKISSVEPVKTTAEKLIDATEKPEEARANVSKEKHSSGAKQTNKGVESRSQHKANRNLKSKHRTMLITPQTDNYLKAIATIYRTSVNEIINKALNQYVADKLNDSEIGDKIRILQEIQIDN
jgi:hypothetical protein